MICQFERPDRLCIVDSGGRIVKLNDKDRTELRFNASERLRARKILKRLNADRTISHGPFRMMPLIGES